MYGTQQILGELHRREWGRIVAAVARQVRDLDLAEECTQDAFAAALVDWDRAGVVPASPRAWLITAARRRAIDRIRQQRVRAEHAREELALGDESSSPPESLRDFDDRLRLLFTCCHPALPVDAQVALTLRVLLGMTTDEIARAFLAPVPTIQQRIGRSPYECPSGRWPRLAERKVAA